MKISNLRLGIIYITFVMFMPSSFYLINWPGYPLISIRRLYVFLWIAVYLVLLIKYSGVRKSMIDMPYFKASIFFLVLLGTVSALTYASNPTGMTNFIALATETIFPMFMIWSAFKKKESLLFAIKIMIYIYSIFALYGIIAYFFKFNPLLNIMSSGNDSRNLVFIYNDIRGGIQGRAQSFFYHPIVFGYLSSVILIVLLGVQSVVKLLPRLMFFFIFAVLMSSIFLTSSRSPIVLLLVAFLIFIAHVNLSKRVSTFGIIIITLFIAYIVLPNSFFDKYSLLIYSIYGDSVKSDLEYGGSSLQQRLSQFGIAVKYFQESPIFGHGLAFIRKLIESKSAGELLGAESFLFKLLIEVGVIGSYAYFALYKKIYSKFRDSTVGNANDLIKKVSLTGKALLGGHLAFIFTTGDMDMFNIFLILVTLLLLLIKFLNCDGIYYATSNLYSIMDLESHVNKKYNNIIKEF